MTGTAIFVPDDVMDIESAEILAVTTRLLKLRDGRWFLSPGGEVDAETADLLRRNYGTRRRSEER